MAVPPRARGPDDPCAHTGAHDGGRVHPVGSKRTGHVPPADSLVTIYVSRGAVQWQGRCHPGLKTTLHLTICASAASATGGGRWTFTASGPTTNLAARIAGLTRGGEVKVGPETAARIRDQYVLEDTGEHPLNGIGESATIGSTPALASSTSRSRRTPCGEPSTTPAAPAWTPPRGGGRLSGGRPRSRAGRAARRGRQRTSPS